MACHPLAENQELLQAQFAADFCTGLAADAHRFDAGEIAFQIFRKLMEKRLADHRTQNSIAKKLQSLIGDQSMIRARRMGQRTP